MTLFDGLERGGQPRRPDRPLTVTELTRRIRGLLEDSFPLVAVTGEIANLRRPTSGHIYLTLKDASAQISAVIWRGAAEELRFALEDGLAVVARGEITVYEPRGSYQLIIRSLEPRGMGALELAFRRLCARLEGEGLFAPERKKPIPEYPAVVGIVTAPTGAAIADMIHVIERRFPRLRALLYPVSVQGAAAAGEIAAAIRAMNALKAADVLIVGRGGGSLEDLWAFNEEAVARAIAASKIPIISAVGHEIDITVSDLVADERAATPTAAAERVTRAWAGAEARLELAGGRLALGLRRRLRETRERMARLSRAHAFRSPLERAPWRQQRLDELAQRAVQAQHRRLRLAGEKMAGMVGRMGALNPSRVLARGYSITTRLGDGRPIREAKALSGGEMVRTRLFRGEFLSRVEAFAAPERSPAATGNKG